MMKYLEGEEITNEELKAAIRRATINVEFFPVLCGSVHLQGISSSNLRQFQQLLRSIFHGIRLLDQRNQLEYLLQEYLYQGH